MSTGKYKLVDGKQVELTQEELEALQEQAFEEPNETANQKAERVEKEMSVYFHRNIATYGLNVIEFYEGLTAVLRSALKQALIIANELNEPLNTDYMIYKIQNADKEPSLTDEQFDIIKTELINIIQS